MFPGGCLVCPSGCQPHSDMKGWPGYTVTLLSSQDPEWTKAEGLFNLLFQKASFRLAGKAPGKHKLCPHLGNSSLRAPCRAFLTSAETQQKEKEEDIDNWNQDTHLAVLLLSHSWKRP